MDTPETDAGTVMHPQHAQAAALLPWYVNGTLAADERALVRTHLGECLVCRREAQRLGHLARAVTGTLGEYGCSQAYARLATHIEGRAQPWYRRGLRALVGAIAPLPLAAGAAVLGCSAIAVALIVLGGTPPPASPGQSFQTLGQHRVAASTLDRPRLRVVLRDGVNTAARAAWLARHDAELVDGPSAIGVMTVTVPLASMPFEELVEDIRGDADTLFVEPVSAVGKRPDRQR
ncbi:MAG: zf-HC2 domain-containing protein [Gammaproteobacteria bacterium]